MRIRRPGAARRSAVPLALLALAGVLPAVAPATASAAPSFSDCAGEIPGQCARVQVPLDRSGHVPGTVSLLVRRTGTGTGDHHHAVLGLAGGPGQSAITAFGEGYVDTLGPLLDGHDLLLVDVRGSGRSGALRCPELERAKRSQRAGAGAACAARLGPKRSFYTTRDTVEDIEKVRHDLGVSKLTLFGVSYGTKVALAYAAAHPSHVERMLLDSILLPEGPDPLYRPSLSALRRVLPALCSGRTCRRITTHLWHDVAQLASRLRRHRLHGRVVGADGRSRSASLDEAELFSILLDGDEISMLRSDIPSAVHSALHGDAAPLLRLTNPDLASRGSDASAGIGFSEALYAATSCEEMPFPWSRTAPISERPGQLHAALEAQPLSAFAPFGRAVPPATDFLKVCSRWPVRAAAPVLTSGPLPDVPALLLDGEDDIRTSIEQAGIARSRLPEGRLLTVEAAGHNVTGGAVPRCVKRAIATWVHGGAPPARCRRARADAITPVLPRRLRDVPAPRGSSGRPGRTLGSVISTLGDIAVQRGRFTQRGAGLRGGRFGPARGAVVSLSRVSLVQGVTVSGRISGAGRVVARLTIGGADAARGSLTLRSDGSLAGALGGRQVRGRVAGGVLRALRRAE